MAEDAPALWDAILARGVIPCGLGARDTLRLEVCYPLHGNDIGPQWDAISAGLGWVCALETDFTGAERLREVARGGPERKLVAFRMTEQAIPRQGMAIDGGGEVTSGSLSPMLDVGIGLGYVPGRAGRARNGADDRRPRPAARAREVVTKPIYETRRSECGRERVLPGRPAVQPRARLGPDRGRRGRARDHLVRRTTRSASSSTTSRPRRARRSRRTRSYGEVESVKAVSDVIAPLSGEVLAVNPKVVDGARDRERGRRTARAG